LSISRPFMVVCCRFGNSIWSSGAWCALRACVAKHVDNGDRVVTCLCSFALRAFVIISLSLAWSAWEDLDMPRARELMVKAKKDALRAGGGEQECASLVDKLKEAESAIAKRTEALGPSFVRVNDPAQVMVGNAIERASLKVREGGADISLLNQRVGDVGMISMAEALMGNATVTWLDISGCNVGPKGVSALAPWIGKSPVLQTLWAASNPLLGDRGCTELAAGLKTNTILAKLDLSNCSVGAQGCTAVVKALQSNPSLRELRLALNNYGTLNHMPSFLSLRTIHSTMAFTRLQLVASWLAPNLCCSI